jgi:hypothetical protein
MDLLTLGRKALLIFQSDTGRTFWVLLAHMQMGLLLRGGLCEKPESVHIPLDELFPPFPFMEKQGRKPYPSKHQFFPECNRNDSNFKPQCSMDVDFVIDHQYPDLIYYGLHRWAHGISVPDKKSRIRFSARILLRSVPTSRDCEYEYDLDMDIHEFSPMDEAIFAYDHGGELQSSNLHRLSQKQRSRNETERRITDSDDDEWITESSESSHVSASNRRHQREPRARKPRATPMVRFTTRPFSEYNARSIAFSSNPPKGVSQENGVSGTFDSETFAKNSGGK